jgi:hypothetical protein
LSHSRFPHFTLHDPSVVEGEFVTKRDRSTTGGDLELSPVTVNRDGSIVGVGVGNFRSKIRREMQDMNY